MEAEEIIDQEEDEALDQDASVPRLWTAEHLRLRLVEAFETSFRIPTDRLGPKEYGNGWPVYSVFAEEVDKNKFINHHGESAKVRAIGAPSAPSVSIRPMAQKIADMDRMMEAARTYSGLSQNIGLLLRWAEARARGTIMDEVAKSLGLSKATFFRHRNSVSNGMARWMNRCGTNTF